jgi:hypothetical protein
VRNHGARAFSLHERAGLNRKRSGRCPPRKAREGPGQGESIGERPTTVPIDTGQCAAHRRTFLRRSRRPRPYHSVEDCGDDKGACSQVPRSSFPIDVYPRAWQSTYGETARGWHTDQPYRQSPRLTRSHSDLSTPCPAVATASSCESHFCSVVVCFDSSDLCTPSMLWHSSR